MKSGPECIIPMLKIPKMIFFHLKRRVLVYSKRYLCPCLCQKMLNFPPEVIVWSLLVDVEDVVILEILKHDKI